MMWRRMIWPKLIASVAGEREYLSFYNVIFVRQKEERIFQTFA